MSRQPPPEVVLAAQAATGSWGIPTSVTLGQWVLESGWGEHEPPASNNPFGMKAGAGEPGVEVLTHEYVAGRDIVVPQVFRVFGSLGEAMLAHGELLATGGPYQASQALLPVAPGDRAGLQAYVKAMGAVYATDPNYAGNLWALIIGNNLVAYDQPMQTENT